MLRQIRGSGRDSPSQARPVYHSSHHTRRRKRASSRSASRSQHIFRERRTLQATNQSRQISPHRYSEPPGPSPPKPHQSLALSSHSLSSPSFSLNLPHKQSFASPLSASFDHYLARILLYCFSDKLPAPALGALPSLLTMFCFTGTTGGHCVHH